MWALGQGHPTVLAWKELQNKGQIETSLGAGLAEVGWQEDVGGDGGPSPDRPLAPPPAPTDHNHRMGDSKSAGGGGGRGGKTGCHHPWKLAPNEFKTRPCFTRGVLGPRCPRALSAPPRTQLGRPWASPA